MSTRGSITKDASGGWSFVVDVPTASGRRRQLRRRGFATKREAQTALAAVVADAHRGSLVVPDRQTLSQFLNDEWLPARRPSLRASTALSYEQLIRNYVEPTIGGVRLQAIDGAILNRLYADLLEHGGREVARRGREGLSPKTVRNLHGVLSRAFHDAMRWGRLVRNPAQAADPPRGASPEMKAWSTEELRAFSAAVSEHRWAGIWALMATTGLRRGEVLGLRWSDVDLDAATITVRSTRVRFGTTIATSTPKTARGNRTVALGPTVVAGLRAWRSTQNADRLRMGAGWQNAGDLVVTLADGAAPNPEAFSDLFRSLAKQAGLPSIRLHDLRHSYATAALAAGVPVKGLSQRIGHADVGVTLKVYAHVLPGDDEEAAARAESLIV